MSQIIAIGNPFDIIPTTRLNISGLETVGQMDLKLALQGAELEHGLAERIAGIGSPRALGVLREVQNYRKAHLMLHRPDWSPRQKHRGLMQLAAQIDEEHLAGIGFLNKLRKKISSAAKKVGTAVARTARAVRQSNLIKKVATGVKKAGQFAIKTTVAVTKGIIKVATLPARLFVKGLIEVILPRISRFFVYLFITNPATIDALPATVKRKRQKAERFAKFIINVVGMKEDHFMKIVRNGILKTTKQTPEQLLAAHVKGSLSGVGVLPLLALIPPIIQLIGKIASLFKKKPSADETPTAEDVPDENKDFDDTPVPIKRQVLTHLKHKPASQQGYQPAPPTEEAREQQQEATALEQVQAEPASTPLEAPLPEPAPVVSYDPAVRAQPGYDGDQAAPASYEAEPGYDPFADPLPEEQAAGEQPQF